MNKKQYHQLDQKERDRIYLLTKQGLTNKAIAKLLGRDKTTIGRELKRNVSETQADIQDQKAKVNMSCDCCDCADCSCDCVN